MSEPTIPETSARATNATDNQDSNAAASKTTSAPIEPAPTSAGPWYLRWRLGANRYDATELAGAFGDLGTLIPFVVGYLVVLKLDPLGILLMLGVSQIAVGLFYKTPIPVQPMKAIGAAAIASGGAITPAMVCGAGLFTGLFWFLLGTTKTVNLATKLAAKPIVRGLMLGLGLLFITDGLQMMRTTPWLGGAGLVLTFVLLTYPRVPAMFALLLLGAGAAYVLDPAHATQLLSTPPTLRLPELAVARMSAGDFVTGALVLAIPQLPLTIGNAVVAIRSENNELFPDRPVTDRMMAVSQGLMNLAAAPLGGIPMCHGAGGMAGHVRFGARTGGSLVMLGTLMLVLALFFSESVGLLFEIFPRAILGVVLFFTGTELALTIRDIGNARNDVYVMLVVAAIAMWNLGAAFIAGILLHQAVERRWLAV